MTFLSAPLAVDGSTLTSAHVRKGTYASLGGAEGLVDKIDLKVSQLATPGNGLLISAGNAALLNRYQSVPNEAYVAANPTTHTVLSTSMPTSQPSAKSYLVLLTVGDPEFSQVGHPWMPSTIDPEDAPDYEYVQIYLLEVAPGTESFDGLGLNYPAYALARVNIPANTTTILNSYIVDLRKMARPRVSEELYIDNSGIANTLNAITPSWEGFTGSSPTIAIPKWATVAKIQGYVESAVHSKATNGNFRISITGGGTTANIPFNRSAPGDGVSDRGGINFGGTINVAAIAGTSKVFALQGQVLSAPSAGGLTSDASTSTLLRVRFEEVPV